MTSVRIAFDVAAVVWWLRMAFTVAERPASRWQTRWAGKAASLAFLLLFVSVWFGFFVPWGAAVVWWRVIIAGRDPFELAMADGRRAR